MSEKDKIENKNLLEELKEKAQREGLAFICRISADQLKNLGFGELWEPDDDFWNSFVEVNIYLSYNNGQYSISYEFLDEYEDVVDEYTEGESDIMLPDGTPYFWEVVEEYLRYAD